MMKTKILILMALIALVIPLMAQEEDTLCAARLMVMYELTYREDTNHLDFARTEQMMLLIGDDVSFFQSYTAYRVLKNLRRAMQDGVFAKQYNVKQEVIPRYQYKVYKNHPKGKVTMMDRVLMSGTFLYEEDYPCMTWEYTEDTATIAGHFTQKAVCDYGGRSWEAWFAPELPFNDGPYMFCGLPGLIVKVADTQDHYCFEMLSAEIPEEMYILWDDKDVSYYSGAFSVQETVYTLRPMEVMASVRLRF